MTRTYIVCLFAWVFYVLSYNTSFAQQKGDTLQIQRDARQLAEITRMRNVVPNNAILKDVGDALSSFADSTIFKGDREKLQMRKDLNTSDVQVFVRQMTSALATDSIPLWEEVASKKEHFEELADIVSYFSSGEWTQEQIFTIYDDLLRKGEQSIMPVKGQFDSPIKYGANRTKIEGKTGTMVMWDEAYVTMGPQELKAAEIQYTAQKGLVRAFGRPDSTGKVIGKPVFKDGEMAYHANEMLFNFNTKKGLIKGIVTKEGDGIIQSKVIKKTQDIPVFMEDNIYTTCNLEHPHYGIWSKRMKVIPKKAIVSGPFVFQLNDVPLPLGFLFGIFPATGKTSSGIITPSFGESADRGFFLRDGGVFLSISDYMAARITGSFYTLGGWSAGSELNYRKRYSFSGRMAFSYVKGVFQTPDFKKQVVNDYRIMWSHSQESIGARRFNANVNIATQNYNRNNSFNVNDYLNSTINSNVSYSDAFDVAGVPVLVTAGVRHNQNTITGEASLGPDVTLGITRVRPFASLFKGGRNPLSELNFAYNFRASGQMTNKPPAQNGGFPFPIVNPPVENPNLEPETLPDGIQALPDLFGNFSTYAKDFKYGATFDLPVSTNFSLLKVLRFSPSFNYKEYWYPQRYKFTWVEEQQAVQVDTMRQFSRSYEYSTGVSVNTNMFMFYNMKNGARIRHTMRPSISYNFRPDFSDPRFGFYQYVQTKSSTTPVGPMENIEDTRTGQQIFNSYGGGQGQPGAGLSSAISFSMSNQLELKRAKKGEDGKQQKVMLLNNLSLSTSYDFTRDSLNLSNINISGNTTLFKKIDINFNATFDPYQYVATGYRIDSETGKRVVASQYRSRHFLWGSSRKLASMSSLNLSLGTTLSPKGTENEKKKQIDAIRPRTDAEADMLEEIRRNPNLYMDFNIPWSLSISYIYSWNKTGLLEANQTQTLSFRGEVSLTPKWRFSFNSGYDFVKKGFSFTTFDLSRDLHCWQMSLNWVPFGPRQSYFVTIAAKSSLLQDLKWQKRDSWFDRASKYY